MNHREWENVFRLFFPDSVPSERDAAHSLSDFSVVALVKCWRQSSNPALSAPSAAALVFHVQNRKGKQQLALSEQHLLPELLFVLTGWHIGTTKKPQTRKCSFSSQQFKGFCDGFNFFLRWLIRDLGCFSWQPALLDLEVFNARWSPSHNDSGEVQIQAFSFTNPHVECDQMVAHGSVPVPCRVLHQPNHSRRMAQGSCLEVWPHESSFDCNILSICTRWKDGSRFEGP